MNGYDALAFALGACAIIFGLMMEFNEQAFFSTLWFVFSVLSAAYFMAIGYVERVVVPRLLAKHADDCPIMDRKTKDKLRQKIGS